MFVVDERSGLAISYASDRPQARGRERAKRAPKLVLGTLKNTAQ